MGLTDKQKRFCDEYLVDSNATQAAIRAGYCQKTAGQIGNENLKKLEIKNYIEERLKEIESEKIATAEEVLQYLTMVVRGESESEVVVIEDGAAKRMKKAPDEKERLKAAELLGKRYSLFTDKIDANVPITVTVNYNYDEND